MSKKLPPCYDRKKHSDCPRRSPDCHQHCKAWKEYEKSRNEDYDTTHLERSYSDYVYERNARKKRRKDKYAGSDEQ